MRMRLWIALTLVAAGGLFSSCRFAAPMLEDAGGRSCTGDCYMGGKNTAILRQWGRDMRENEREVDHLFFNYDVNDPYRGDCLVGY